ncbi:MAG: methytransferase partner Trm112 [Candidatus Thermoplasmatota archaeon]|jgi:uncharacterized protein YbaR (Trm112 family)|nr:methytransferase partner Trm112 [Candidatus Thermoplasmatota archaeon]MCL5984712.1 methytransferase partner Trm112 [Candidatus Thermoplasmatota archaeon]
MKKDLMELLCCPLCRGDLTLEARKEAKGEILDGTIQCTKCSAKFPIEDGIPNMLPPELR